MLRAEVYYSQAKFVVLPASRLSCELQEPLPERPIQRAMLLAGD